MAYGRAWILRGGRKNSKPACRRWRAVQGKMLDAKRPTRPVDALLANFTIWLEPLLLEDGFPYNLNDAQANQSHEN